MAFSKKLTDLLAESCDVARADGADIVAFLMKGDGARGCMSFANTNDPATLLCVITALFENVEDNTGMGRKKLWKLMNKSIKTTLVARKRGEYAKDIADFD